MEPKIFSFEPNLYRTFNKFMGYDPKKMMFKYAPGYASFISGGKLYTRFVKLMETLNVEDSTGYPTKLFYMRYYYLTLLSEKLNKSLSQITVDDIINNVLNINVGYSVIGELVAFGFPIMSDNFHSKWEHRKNGFKYVGRNPTGMINLVSFNNMVFHENDLFTKYYNIYDVMNNKQCIIAKCKKNDLNIVLNQSSDADFDYIVAVILRTITDDFKTYIKSDDARLVHIKLKDVFSMILYNVVVTHEDRTVNFYCRKINKFMDKISLYSGQQYLDRQYKEFLIKKTEFLNYNYRCAVNYI